MPATPGTRHIVTWIAACAAAPALHVLLLWSWDMFHAAPARLPADYTGLSFLPALHAVGVLAFALASLTLNVLLQPLLQRYALRAILPELGWEQWLPIVWGLVLLRYPVAAIIGFAFDVFPFCDGAALGSALFGYEAANPDHVLLRFEWRNFIASQLVDVACFAVLPAICLARRIAIGWQKLALAALVGDIILTLLQCEAATISWRHAVHSAVAAPGFDWGYLAGVVLRMLEQAAGGAVTCLLLALLSRPANAALPLRPTTWLATGLVTLSLLTLSLLLPWLLPLCGLPLLVT